MYTIIILGWKLRESKSTRRKRTANFSDLSKWPEAFPSLGDSARQRGGGRISSISFLKKARTRQWGFYTRPDTWFLCLASNPSQIEEISELSFFSYSPKLVEIWDTLVSFWIIMTGNSCFLAAICNVWRAGGGSCRWEGRTRKEARFHASLGQTGEKSTWWHMARKDAKDFYRFCQSTNLVIFIHHLLCVRQLTCSVFFCV